MNSTEMAPQTEVHLGCVVLVTDRSQGAHKTFRLVSPHEAQPAEGRLSILSPIARALVGHRVGDLVEVRTPRGVRPLVIGAIS